MTHTVTWIDRLRIERVVWALDQRLYDLPRKSRIAKRREVRANLRTAAADIGTANALRNIGNSRQLAGEYLDRRIRRPAPTVLARRGDLPPYRPADPHISPERSCTGVRRRHHRRRPTRHGHVHLGRHPLRAKQRHLHLRKRPRRFRRRRLDAPGLGPLAHRHRPRRPALAGDSGLAQPTGQPHPGDMKTPQPGRSSPTRHPPSAGGCVAEHRTYLPVPAPDVIRSLATGLERSVRFGVVDNRVGSGEVQALVARV